MVAEVNIPLGFSFLSLIGSVASVGCSPTSALCKLFSPSEVRLPSPGNNVGVPTPGRFSGFAGAPDSEHSKTNRGSVEGLY